MIGEAGLSHLLPLLPHMVALDSLLLDANSLGTRGARALARALAPTPGGAKKAGAVPSTEEEEKEEDEEGGGVPCARLRVLSLASNGIGVGGAAELAAALVPVGPSGPSPCQMYVGLTSLGGRGVVV
jgi:hypothetical protein